MKKEQIKQQRIYNNKGVNTLSWVLYHLLPYCIYTKLLPLSLKSITRPYRIKATMYHDKKQSWWEKFKWLIATEHVYMHPNFYNPTYFMDKLKKDNPGKEIVFIDVENFDNLPLQPEDENIVIGYRMAYKG